MDPFYKKYETEDKDLTLAIQEVKAIYQKKILLLNEIKTISNNVTKDPSTFPILIDTAKKLLKI